MSVTKMTREDIPEVAQLERECFGDEAWNENMLIPEIEDDNKHYFVIKRENKIVAYGGFAQVLDEGHINNIGVTESARRQGCGEAILNKFFETANELGIGSFTLEVRVGNIPARKLYEKMGFVEEGVRKKYYRDGEDCCIYWKYL